MTKPTQGTVCNPNAKSSHGEPVQNLKSLLSSTAKIWKASKNAQIVVVWGLGITECHRQHTHWTERIWLPIRRLSCTVFELLSRISQNLKMSRESDHAHIWEFVIPMLSYHMANQCTTFEVSGFRLSRGTLGETKNLNWSHDHKHAPFRDRLSSVGWD